MDLRDVRESNKNHLNFPQMHVEYIYTHTHVGQPPEIHVKLLALIQFGTWVCIYTHTCKAYMHMHTIPALSISTISAFYTFKKNRLGQRMLMTRLHDKHISLALLNPSIFSSVLLLNPILGQRAQLIQCELRHFNPRSQLMNVAYHFRKTLLIILPQVHGWSKFVSYAKKHKR